MKKVIMLLIAIIFTYGFVGSAISKSNIIPDDAIRIRIIANSNSEYDQSIKRIVKEEVETNMYNLLKDTKKITEARKLIQENLTKLENGIYLTLQKQNYNLPFAVNFGLNYFPSKEFKGIHYDEGYYESVVVTLGNGLGDNWWCVLFPPLCTLEAEESTDVEYTTMVNEIINKYFK